MKKITLALLIVVLFVPAVVLAQQDEDSPGPRRSRSAGARERINSEELRGEIISVSKNAVTITSGTEDDPEVIKIRIPERRSQLRGLLAQGLGQKAELQCHKTSQGTLTLIRIEGIEGVDLSSQSRPGFGEGMRQEGRGRGMPGQFGGEQQPVMGGRFGAMAEHLRENPELREELRELAREDPEAFRERIRELMPELHQRQGPDGRQEGGRPGGMHDQHGQGPMGQMGQGREMGPTGQQGRRRSSPENEQTQKLERQTHELAREYRQAEGPEKRELEDKLRAALLETFEAKAQLQNQQVEYLEKQLEKLRDRLEKRRKNSEAIIDQRFEQLTGQQGNELAW